MAAFRNEATRRSGVAAVHDEADDGGDDDGIPDSSRLTFDWFLHLLGQMQDARRKRRGSCRCHYPAVQSDQRATARDGPRTAALDNKAAATSKKASGSLARQPSKMSRARPKTETQQFCAAAETPPPILADNAVALLIAIDAQAARSLTHSLILSLCSSEFLCDSCDSVPLSVTRT
ncbi:hypothetical protein THAR02_10792 [Trichoderma harzianum]|uniref:Uncharacterized protein n=1 Tax=Trichoderma harzianum TaxID=5544 RepID=A0A0F9WVE5_TRIHA|nr:hypothetical protein THAR02_10792 [Trichoderma harzianum]